MTKYNDNITLIGKAERTDSLNKDQFFALMVEDHDNKPGKDRPRSDFFDAENGWIGLECTSDGQVYISKEFERRCNPWRGKPMIVRVKDVKQCYRLDK